MTTKHIIVAEDDLHMQTAVKYRLEREGFKVQIASDGAETWEKVQGAPPDLLILDLMLPKLDGYQLLQRLKRNRNTAHIPVIVVTGRGIGERERCLDLGASAFILKPFHFQHLINMVKATLASPLH